MHIAFWSPAWPLEKHQNGIITYVHAMKAGLEKRGHRVSVFTGRCDSGEAIEVSPSWRRRLENKLSRKEFNAAFSAVISDAILREHCKNPIDVIEMEESFGWCADVAERTGIPMVVKLHGPAFYRENFPEKIHREGLALARCRTIISPSQETLRGTLERYQLSNKDTQVIVNPVVTDENWPAWSLSGCNRKTISFIGRVDLKKGADIALKAMRLVLRSHPDARLIVVGPDYGLPDNHGLKVPFLWHREEMFEREVRDNIIHRGPLPHHELAAIRASSMVTIVASRWENLPYTLLESMAQGCPVVSTNAGGCAEVVSHGKTGLLARSENPESFAEQICAILDNPENAATMGSAARDYVRKHYSIESVVDETMECYRRVLSSRIGSSSGLAARCAQ